MEKIKWGIIGLGNIANKFANDLSLVPDATLVAVASTSKERAQNFASKYDVKTSYGSYDELFNDPDVFVVYIATPHNLHAELSIKAMQAGKHVLCEKPIAVNMSEFKTMRKVARENNRFLMEALWTRFNPSLNKLHSLVKDNIIGKPSYVNADFTFYALDRGDNKRLLNPNLAGGSLLDIGLYPVFFAYLLLGKPSKIIATANFYKTGAEKQVSIIFDYPDAQAVLHSGFSSDLQASAKVVGPKGCIGLLPSWHKAEGYFMELDKNKETFKLPLKGLGYVHEIIEVHQCLRAGKLESTQWSLTNTEDLLELLDKIRKIIGVKFPFE
ncbi:Gfo/Idh/MocA family protein [Croceivirga sp. JEA036]|uniref:Gfo/Idh/MocA family protein n=1 Tax=Croceivirga sp. JEA036 TaxID=2721162 RepID=UPI00143C833E|nr:Gfo/Idh/MocA family oxidoreductase [Croceivirga sp. JEA036]NJB35484.1 Gfo/Idh/MocA family oxidoreductase [Croceivirga sp. JEA036]